MIIALATPVLVLAAVWFGEPYFAMHQLQSALERADEAEIERLVDFESLHAEIRKEVKGQIKRQRRSGNVMGALASGMAMRNLDATVDGFLSPDGLSALMSPGKSDVKLRPERSSLNDFVVWAANKDGRENGLVFRREDGGWRLVSVKLSR